MRADGLVVAPTETLYGLAAIATSARAVESLVRAKHREAIKTIPLIAGEREQVEAFAHVPPLLGKLAEAFWPGPLTLALAPRKELPQALCARDGTIGIRVSSHPLARALAREVGVITATSANLSGGAAARDAREIAPLLLRATDLVLDAGVCGEKLPSSVVGLCDGQVVIYREGAISRAALAAVIGYLPEIARGV